MAISRQALPKSSATVLFLFCIYSIVLVVILDRTNGESVNLFRCCPPDAILENGTCNARLVQKQNGSELASQDILTLPKHLSMSAYGAEFGQLNFSLKNLPQPPECSNGEFSLKVSLNNLSRNQVNFTLEGYLKIEKDYYAPNEYCIDSFSNEENTFTVVVCNNTCGNNIVNPKNPCIKRCCEFGEVWDLSGVGSGGRLRCLPSGVKQWHPILYNDPYSPVDESKNNILPHFTSDHPRNGWCDPSKAIILSLTSKYKNETTILFRVLADGTIVQKLRAMTWVSIPQSQHCIDGAQNFPGYFDVDHPGFYTGDPSDTIVLACRAKPTGQAIISNLYRIAMIIACVFLLLTIIVYVLLWEKQNVHGWSLLCYIISLFFMYVSLCLMHFSKDLNFTLLDQNGGGGTWCFVIGVSIHFFFLSSFCWLTVINFDLWWTFRALKPTAGKSKGLKRFIVYLLFALGTPITVVSVALGLDFTYRDDIKSDVIIPLYGQTRCYMEQHKPMLVYVYGPIGILISLNIIFFLVTIYSMYKIQKSTKFASASSSKVNKQNQSARLFAKLFIVMGVSWISEVISWAMSEEGKVEWYFVIFDMINILQAIFIFIIFVCKKETLRSLEQKYPKFRTLVSVLTRRSEGTTSSSKSTGTELSFTDTNMTGVDRIEMSTTPQQQIQRDGQ